MTIFKTAGSSTQALIDHNYMECENDIIAKLERRESLKRDEFLRLLERVRKRYLKYEYYFTIQRLCLFPYKS
jgi:hypothetical protein